MKKIKRILPIIIILSLSLTACAANNGESPTTDVIGQTPNVEVTDKEAKAPSADPTDNRDEATAYEDITLTFADAFNIYAKKFPNTKVKKVELDTDYGAYVYEVEGYDASKEYEIEIHPVSGEILKESIENDNDNHGELTLDHAGKVETIISKALGEAGESAIIKEVTLKNKKGRVEVEVEVDKEGSGDTEYKYDIEGTLIEID